MPSVKSILKEIGKEYIAAIEDSIGAELKVGNQGLRFEIPNLFDALGLFYKKWSLKTGEPRILYWTSEVGQEGHELPDDIHSPIRDKLAGKGSTGIYLTTQVNRLESIKATLMFADAILFWDPFESILADNHGAKAGLDVEGSLQHLMCLRELILEGLVVPAQVAANWIAVDQPRLQRSGFDVPLMLQGSLGLEEFNARLVDDGQLRIAADLLEMAGNRGHAENKFMQMMLPDIAVPIMDDSSRDDYLQFCRNLEKPPHWREEHYAVRALSFESGFVLDADKLSVSQLIELRNNDAIFEAFRTAISEAIDDYEKSLIGGYSASFIIDFNTRIAGEFKKLKTSGQVSNVWKDYIDESKSLSKKIAIKISDKPLDLAALLSDFTDHLGDIAKPSIVNIIAGALKTYRRHRATKLFLEIAASIRENHKPS